MEYQNNNTKLLFKDFLSKKDLRTYLNYLLQGRGKVSRIVSYSSTGAIYIVKSSSPTIFNLDNSKMQSIDFDKKEVVFTISNKEFKSVMNTIIFYRKFPESRIKQNNINFPNL